MKIALVSDTHRFHNEIVWPDADILVHAGDITTFGTSKELHKFNQWVDKSQYSKVICIAGNHDTLFIRDLAKAKRMLKSEKIIYLEDSSYEIGGVRFYGSPWTRLLPGLSSVWAFGDKETPDGLELHWKKIPRDVDVLITHSPPYGILDQDALEDSLGSPSLYRYVTGKIMPKVHVFGHIHEGYGVKEEGPHTIFFNAAACDVNYRPVNPVRVINI